MKKGDSKRQYGIKSKNEKGVDLTNITYTLFLSSSKKKTHIPH